MQVSDFAVKVAILAVVVTLLPASPFVGFTYLVNALPYLSF